MIPTFSFSSESNEHYTPRHVIDYARMVLHDIDLDPASCAIANQIVKASRYFTIEDDGLKQDWNARAVWCNPPYGYEGAIDQRKKVNGNPNPLFGQWNTHLGRPNQQIWLEKMIREFDRGMFNEGIVLVNAAVSSTWFKPAYRFPICFTDGRLEFLGPDLKPRKQPTKDNAIVYMGDNIDRFVEVFDDKIGTVVIRAAQLKRISSVTVTV